MHLPPSAIYTGLASFIFGMIIGGFLAANVIEGFVTILIIAILAFVAYGIAQSSNDK